MALLLRGKIWYVYYRGPEGRMVSVSTGLKKKKDAEATDGAKMAITRAPKYRKHSRSRGITHRVAGAILLLKLKA